MKKLTTLFLLSLIVLSTSISCSSDDGGNENPANVVLIKKITEVSVADETETTIHFFYQNNVLVSITQENYRTEFTYNGNKVTLMKHFNNNVQTGQTIFSYNGDLLDYTLSGEDADEKIQYYYTNGILSKAESGYIGNNNEFVVLQTEEVSFNGSNISEVNTYGNNGGFNYSYRSKYSYDNKNCPAKFMNKHLRFLISTAGFMGINQNNYLTKETFSPSDSTTPFAQTFEIAYDENDFPTEIKEFSTNNTLRSITKIEYQ